MSFTDLITIAIPCYERKQYFLEALESAINQTIKCEIIVVDNCSSHDYFEKVCNEKSIVYYKNERNIGLFPNYNRCYALAKTEYVKILDDDDILLPEYVESFVNAKNLYPDIDIYYSDYVFLKSGKDLTHPDTLPFGYIEKGKEIIEYAIKHTLSFPYMSSVVKATNAQLDIDKEECIGGYDFVWLYNQADQLSFYGENAKLYKWRIHNDNASENKKDWVANALTIPYIYQTIMYDKIAEPKLKSKITKKVFWKLIWLKSYGDKEEIKKIMISNNRFGAFLKEKMHNNFLLKVIFKIPRRVVRNFYKLSRKLGIAC